MRRLEVITREAEMLPVEKQAEVLDFIAFLKMKQLSEQLGSSLKTPEETEKFFRSFAIDVSDYQFDREEANAR